MRRSVLTLALALAAGAAVAAPVYPTTLTFIQGLFVPPGVSVLHFQDSQFLTCAPFTGAYQFEVRGTTSVTNPTVFQVKCRSRLAGAGTLRQTIEVYNFALGAWETGVVTFPLSTVYTWSVFNGTGNLSKYVGPAGLVRARVTGRPTGPLVGNGRYDVLIWDVQ